MPHSSEGFHKISLKSYPSAQYTPWVRYTGSLTTRIKVIDDKQTSTINHRTKQYGTKDTNIVKNKQVINRT